MAINTKIAANKRPGVNAGKADGPKPDGFGSGTRYAEFSKTKVGVTNQPRPKVPSPGTTKKGK